MLLNLPQDLADIVCGFAYNARLGETLRSLYIIMELKTNYIHPYVKAQRVPDYTECVDGWCYCRRDMRPGLLAPFNPMISRAASPFDTFFVWFSFCDLWNMNTISQVINDLDWRRVQWIKRETGMIDRHAFMFWVATTTIGVLYCSRLFTRIKLSMLKKYPSSVTRRLVSNKFDEWTAFM